MRTFLFTLLAVSLLTSCSDSSKPKVPGLTAKDYIIFCEKLDSAINSGNAAFLVQHVNGEALADSVIMKQNKDASAAQNFRSLFLKGLERGLPGLAEQICDQMTMNAPTSSFAFTIKTMFPTACSA